MLSRLHLPCLLVAIASCTAVPEQKPRPLQNTRPKYPPVANLHGRSGTVDLDCTITGTGNATDCVTAGGDHDFVAAALEYMQHARYVPSLRDGIPVAYTHYTTRIRFEATSPKPITIPVHCDVAASGTIRNCRPDAARPPRLWPIIKGMAEDARLPPREADGRAIDDPARALLLSFAYVRLPWVGPTPEVGGETKLMAQIACDRRTIEPPAISITCRWEQQSDAPPQWDAVDHLRVYLGMGAAVPAPTGEFDDPS